MTVLNPSCSGSAGLCTGTALPVPRLLAVAPQALRRCWGAAPSGARGTLPRALPGFCARASPSSSPFSSQRHTGEAALGCDLRGINFSSSGSTQYHTPPQQRISMKFMGPLQTCLHK